MKKIYKVFLVMSVPFFCMSQTVPGETRNHILPSEKALITTNMIKSPKHGNENGDAPVNISTDSTRATLAIIENFNNAFNRHDVDAVMAAMTEDCVFENTNPAPDGSRYVGAVEVRAYWERFFKNNPDAHFEAEEIIAAGDRCIVRWIYRKTKDGKPWHLKGVDIFKVREGKVAEKLAYVKG